MAKESKHKAGSQKDRLKEELIRMIPEISEEGLVFLIRQADTIIHNQRKSMLNKEIQELNTNKANAPGNASEGSKNFDVSISRSDNGKTYYFVVNGRKHFFDVPETRKIVALCYRPQTKSAALKYLYEFFLNERDEILSEHRISSEKSPFFEELFREVRANFTLQD